MPLTIPEHQLCSTFDARVWAEQFTEMYTLEGKTKEETTEIMHGWFANAIMAGYDHALNKVAPGMNFPPPQENTHA